MSLPYRQLMEMKRWADSGLCAAFRHNRDRLGEQEQAIMIRILDHFHVVDRIFRHHLEGRPHGFLAAQSEVPPDLDGLVSGIEKVDDWYVDYAASLPPEAFEEPVDFVFTSGKPARMRRGEILLHISLHGTYHRGNAGALLQLNGLAPSRDSITDFLEASGEPASPTPA